MPLLPTPSFSFPSQPAASSVSFTNEPAPTPGRHAPVHPTTSPSEASQAPVPAGFAPVLPSASPREALPKAPVPAGSAPVLPSASPREALPKAPVPSGSAPVRPSAPLAGAFPLAPVPGGCAPVHPAVPPVAVSFHGHTSGTQTPAPCARPLTGPCPTSNHTFLSASGLSEDLASSASPSVGAPARSPEGRAPCVVEIFAGSCNFSSTAVSMGFQSVAVDHVPAKRWHVLQLDLREPGAQQLLLSTLKCLLPALVVLAPPCGTASRARDIPAYSNGKRIANPLRSGQHPDGLPSLQGHDLARVTSANSLYAFSAAVAGMCSQHGIPWLIENPARSYMWDTSMMSALPEHSQTEVHFCAYGGARRKRTVLKGTPTWLQNLCRTCDGNHSHAPWKDSCGIHTAEEAAYPLPFCQAICLCLRDSLPPHSRPRPMFLGQALPHWRDDALFLRAAVKFQPRSWVFPNLPSPFDLQLFPRSLFDAAWLRGKRLPAGPWPKGSVLPLNPPEAAPDQFWVACPKDPVQHMHSMNGVQHPANMLPPLGQFLEEAVDFVATCPTHDVLSFWAERLRSLLQLAEEFAPRQKQLLASCDAHVARINAKKRTLLLKHVLQTVGYQDTAIADELAAGFPLFGWLPESMELPRHAQPPAVDIASLERMAPALQARALARCQPTDDPAADQTLFDTTLTELQQGWLDGPFLAPDVPSTSVISPRFYVLQSDKCRPIDDFTFNLLNSAVGSANKVVLHDTDFIAALLKRCCSYNKVPWRGRAFDLQDAYRQLAIAPAHRTHSFNTSPCMARGATVC